MLSILASDQSLDTAVAFSSLGDSEHVAVSLSMDFSVRSKIDDSSHRKAFDYSSTDWDSFHNPIRDGPRENLLKLDILVFLLCQLLFLPETFKILGWCPAGSVLPHGEKVPL